jgi:hypothetical protein
MKYQVGDLLLVKEIPPRPRLRVPPRPRLHLRLHLLLHPRLNNTFGIITAVEKHGDIFQKDSTENDNGYIWYSQVDNKEYYFYEDEVIGEVVK